MKKCLYTCIINRTDKLKEPKVKTPGWDYICFTDDPELTSKGWTVKLVGNPDNTDPIRLSRRIKHLYHEYIPDYDYSIYIDANRKPIGNMDDALQQTLTEDTDLGMCEHPARICLYDEAVRCIVRKLDDTRLIMKQMFYYMKEGFPPHAGLLGGPMIVRRKGRKNVEKYFEKVYENILKWSRRDQLSFNYILWKYPIVKINLFKWRLSLRGGKFFINQGHDGENIDTTRIWKGTLKEQRVFREGCQYGNFSL